MKRGFTLFLLGLFLLNVLGYYGIFLGLQVNNTLTLQEQFDNDDYAHLKEVTVKVPLTVPYQSDTREYVRVNGEFEHEGDVYKMVKQRLQRDTLYIVCVKDNTSKKIKQALRDYVKTYTDKPVNQKGNPKTIQNFIKDYISTATVLQNHEDGWFQVIHASGWLSSYQSLSIQHISPPPQG
ncbi:MAG: hypothetical protein JNM78_05870 [Cyclobacteriaceae bacterium]|nr:hypothetical protein [Cyclobacteriaceae bacterium]